jgi:integrase
MRESKERVHGPYRHRNRWRVVAVGADGSRHVASFTSEEEADDFAEQARGQASERTVRGAIEAYVKHQRDRGLRKTTTDREEAHLHAMLRSDVNGERRLGWVTPKRSASLYDQAQKDMAVDTHRNGLMVVRAWGRWCGANGWVTPVPFADVKPLGRRKRGKPQPRVDEARALADRCLALAENDDCAIATVMAILFGLRASEIIGRDVRDVDDGGRLLWIPCSKTEAGRRTLEVPDVVRPLLLARAAGRGAREPLLRDRHGERPTRHWVYYHVTRLCTAAGIEDVSPHGLRGLHATLATLGGGTAHQVAAALGHADGGELAASTYIAGGVVQAERQRTALKVLAGGRR